MANQIVYDLNSCGSHDSIYGLTLGGNQASPFVFSAIGALVYINDSRYGAVVSAETYTLDLAPVQGVFAQRIPSLEASDLVSCADTNKDKFYRVVQCGLPKNERYVFFSAAQTIGDVVVFSGEETAWIITELISYYTETLTVSATYSRCKEANAALAAATTISANDERSVSWAVRVVPIEIEPANRGFNDCCYANLVLADLSDDDEYKNDYTAVYYQRQTPADTISYEIIKVGGGTTSLVDVTHGVLYDFDPLHHNPDLTYFKVEWRKILNLLGEGQYTIRMNIVVGGLPSVAKDSNTFSLKPFSINRADGTTRFDGFMDGRLEHFNTNFKNSDFQTSLRVNGYFGNESPNLEQENLVYSNKKGLTYYEGQINMNNDPSYSYEAENIPECISRQLIDFLIFSNDILISDYNKNNHSYRYNLFPVLVDEISEPKYPKESRGVTLEMKFKGRSKNKRKTNC